MPGRDVNSIRFQLLKEMDPAILARYDEINRKRQFTGIAGNDAHQNVSFFGYQLDPYPRAFRFVTTHVLAPELTQEAVLEALRKGRSYVAFEGSKRVAGAGGWKQRVRTMPDNDFTISWSEEGEPPRTRSVLWLMTQLGQQPWVYLDYGYPAEERP